jgi:hypothetical protein
MRTELTADLAGATIRGVVTMGAFEEMIGDRAWDAFTAAMDSGDPRVTRAVLRAVLRAAGDFRALEIPAVVDRLIEEAGLGACHTFAIRLVNDAMTKAETVRKNSPAATPAEAAAAEAIG